MSPATIDAGPVAIGALTAAGVLHAVALLLSVWLGVRIAKRRGLRPGLVIETHALAVPLGLLASRARALAEAFPAFLHDARALAGALLGPADVLPGVAAAVAIAGVMAWASRRPRDLADALAPGAVLGVFALLADVQSPSSTQGIALAAAALVFTALAARSARIGAAPGEAALVAGEGVVVEIATRLAGREIPSLPLVGCAVALGLLLIAHVILRAKAALPRAGRPVAGT